MKELIAIIEAGDYRAMNGNLLSSCPEWMKLKEEIALLDPLSRAMRAASDLDEALKVLATKRSQMTWQEKLDEIKNRK